MSTDDDWTVCPTCDGFTGWMESGVWATCDDCSGEGGWIKYDGGPA